MADSGPKRRWRSPESHAYDPWGWGDAEWVCWESESLAARARRPPVGFRPRWRGRGRGLWGPRGAWRGRGPRRGGRGPRRGRRGREPWGGGSPPNEEEEEEEVEEEEAWRGRGRDPWGGRSPPNEEEETEDSWRGRGPRRGGRGWDPWGGERPPHKEEEEEEPWRGRGRDPWGGERPPHKEEEEEEPWRGRGRDPWGGERPPHKEEEEEEPPQQQDPFSRSRWGSREREPPSWEQPPPAKAPRKSHWGGSPKREAGVRVLLTPPRQGSPEQGVPHRQRGWEEWDSARHGVREQQPPPSSPPRGGSWWDEPERRDGESPGREEREWGRQPEEGPQDTAPWGGSEHGAVLGSLERLAWEQGGDQWRNPDWVKDQPGSLAGTGSQSGDPDGAEVEEEPEWDAAEDGAVSGSSAVPAGSDGVSSVPQKWTPCQEVVDFWTRVCRTCLSLRQRRRLMSFCPRPTLPDRSHETPALNAEFANLGATPEQKVLLGDAEKLEWLQDEVLDTLAPAMSIYEMAEEALVKREPVDPLELREWAQRLLRLLGSLTNRLTLHRRVKILRAINPRLQSVCSKMTSRNSNGMLFGEDKVQLLKELLARFPQLSQNNAPHKRTRTHKRRSRVSSSNQPQGTGTQGGGILCFTEEFQQTHTVSQGIWAGRSLPGTQLGHALNWSGFGS